MPSKMKTWTPDQLDKMNQEGFMIDALDMLKFSPEIGDSDAAIDSMIDTLQRVESTVNQTE